MSNQTHEIIEQSIKNHNAVLYMKGTPQQPMCGFSAQVVHVLNHYNVPFKAYNVLDDDALREGIKTYSNWPTIPQLYVKQEFIGGCDIILQMHQQGTLQAALSVSTDKESAQD
jgi:monothiol glutaredoxin